MGFCCFRILVGFRILCLICLFWLFAWFCWLLAFVCVIVCGLRMRGWIRGCYICVVVLSVLLLYLLGWMFDYYCGFYWLLVSDFGFDLPNSVVFILFLFVIWLFGVLIDVFVVVYLWCLLVWILLRRYDRCSAMSCFLWFFCWLELLFVLFYCWCFRLFDLDMLSCLGFGLVVYLDLCLLWVITVTCVFLCYEFSFVDCWVLWFLVGVYVICSCLTVVVYFVFVFFVVCVCLCMLLCGFTLVRWDGCLFMDLINSVVLKL